MTTIPIPLSTELEARLTALAAEMGLSLDDTAHKSLMWGLDELELWQLSERNRADTPQPRKPNEPHDHRLPT